jgi:hypothetical protein
MVKVFLEVRNYPVIQYRGSKKEDGEDLPQPGQGLHK